MLQNYYCNYCSDTCHRRRAQVLLIIANSYLYYKMLCNQTKDLHWNRERLNAILCTLAESSFASRPAFDLIYYECKALWKHNFIQSEYNYSESKA